MSFCRDDGRCEICDPPTRQNPDETGCSYCSYNPAAFVDPDGEPICDDCSLPSPTRCDCRFHDDGTTTVCGIHEPPPPIMYYTEEES